MIPEQSPKGSEGLNHVSVQRKAFLAKKTQFKDLETGEYFVCRERAKRLLLFQEIKSREEWEEMRSFRPWQRLWILL